MTPTTKDAYRLLHDGMLAFADMEANGMRIDVPRLEKTIAKVSRRIDRTEEKLKQDEVYQEWRKLYGKKASLGSRHQLAKVLFDRMGLKSSGKTATGRPSMNAAALERMNVPFVKRYLQLGKLKTLRGTHLKGLLREVEDGFVHPNLNLHLALTYRPSCDRPNLKNIPIRDPEIAKLIRPCFIARDGHQLVEIDVKQIEVSVAACYNRDPVLIRYIENSSMDMHRDMAAECYLCKPSQVSKQMRYSGKNGFVFPQFYGSWFGECAPNLWHAIRESGLEIDGVTLRDWLEGKGIRKLGQKTSNHDTGRIATEKNTFIDHVRKVEDRFWNERFTVYRDWKERWWRAYQKTGEYKMLTGFVGRGVYERNQVINSPIQGSAFHCTLWVIVRLIRWLKRNKMRSKVVIDVYDSIVIDAAEDEVDDVIAKVLELMTVNIRKAWPWIIVPLEVDVEVASVGGSWYDKREWDSN